jgi:hypothetical protein
MKTITLCGCTRFKEDFEGVMREETLNGNIVISVGLFSHSEDGGDAEIVIGEEIKEMLDKIHLHKIDMADEILVINKGGYIRKSTSNEIEYAVKTNKLVRYMIDDQD